ncbi:hypothetical protein ACIXWY_23425 [Bacteroides fragilis]
MAFFYNRRPYPLYHRGFPFYSTIISHTFPYLVSDSSFRLDFPMQRYSGRPASSTTMLTARGFARQPSQIRDVLSVPRHAVPVGLGIP